MDSSHPPVQTHRKKIAARTKVALWLVLGPTVLLFVTILIFAILNLVFNPTFWPTPDTEAFAQTPIALSIANVVLFFAGAVAVISWLPGIIIGTILFLKRPKQSA